MPERIQMSRQRPWRAEHLDAVIVDRSTIWGNPFLMTNVGRSFPSLTTEQCAQFVVNQFRFDPKPGYPSDEDIRAALRGRDLACWCPLDSPCHADVLLEIANQSGATNA